MPVGETLPGFIYLASQSARRSQLLDQLGVRHELLLPDASEDAESLEAVLRNEAPKTYVQRVTGLKLQAALQRLAQRKLPPAPVHVAFQHVVDRQRVDVRLVSHGAQHRAHAACAVQPPAPGVDGNCGGLAGPG